ncbi:MAG: hypothetical protein AAB908_02110 [Patescibacteria group bacterium]
MRTDAPHVQTELRPQGPTITTIIVLMASAALMFGMIFGTIFGLRTGMLVGSICLVWTACCGAVLLWAQHRIDTMPVSIPRTRSSKLQLVKK